VTTTAFGGDEPPPKLELHPANAIAMASSAVLDRIKLRIYRYSPRNRRVTPRRGRIKYCEASLRTAKKMRGKRFRSRGHFVGLASTRAPDT
jgi:hypothetical protein